MLLLKPKRIMMRRGIEKIYTYLTDRGFTRSTANQISSGSLSSLKVKHLGKLCVVLNCTPNDLFEWEDDGKTKLPENHALNALSRGNSAPQSLSDILSDIPSDKLPEIENLIKDLKGG